MNRTITERDEFGFFLETNEPVRAELALRAVEDIVAFVQSRNIFGDDVIIEIIEMGRYGSFWAKFKANAAAIGIAGTLIYNGVGAAKQLYEWVTTEEDEGTRCTARLMLESGAPRVDFVSCEGTLEALRDDIPSINSYVIALNANSDLVATPAAERPTIDNWHAYFNTPTSPDVRTSAPPQAGTAFQDSAFQPGGFGGEKEPMITLTRTGERYAKTPDGRSADMIDGTIIFGTQTVPLRLVRFIDDEGANVRPDPPVNLIGTFRYAGALLEFVTDKGTIYKAKPGEDFEGSIPSGERSFIFATLANDDPKSRNIYVHRVEPIDDR